MNNSINIEMMKTFLKEQSQNSKKYNDMSNDEIKKAYLAYIAYIRTAVKPYMTNNTINSTKMSNDDVRQAYKMLKNMGHIGGKRRTYRSKSYKRSTRRNKSHKRH